MTEALSHYDQVRKSDETVALADRGMDFAIVAARFNEPIVNRLIEGAVATLLARGAVKDKIELIRVPGAFELPAAARLCVESEAFDAVIALGCVIRGQTPHFDYVSSECARGLAELAHNEDIPVIFGVLTTDTREQAEQRSQLLENWLHPDEEHSPTHSNKGAEAAAAALEMIEIFNDWLDDDGD